MKKLIITIIVSANICFIVRGLAFLYATDRHVFIVTVGIIGVAIAHVILWQGIHDCLNKGGDK